MQAITNPNHIAALRIFTLIKGAQLEGLGMRRRGISCLAMLKRDYGLKGSRQAVIEQAETVRQELLSK